MKRILIVDDAMFIRMSLRNMLACHEFEIVGEAENGRVGIAKYVELRPDIVTLDITMPEMDGLTALKGIMQADSQAKVVMISAMGQETHVRQAILTGAKNFIVKPFTEEHVLKVLRAL